MSGTSLRALQQNMSTLNFLDFPSMTSRDAQNWLLTSLDEDENPFEEFYEGNKSISIDSEAEDTDTSLGSMSVSSVSSVYSLSPPEQDEFFEVELLYDEFPFWIAEAATNPDQPLIPFLGNIVACCVCGGPNFMLNFICICDGCHKGFHQTCHNPEITDSSVNRQNAKGEPWFCTECQLKDYPKVGCKKWEERMIESKNKDMEWGQSDTENHKRYSITTVVDRGKEKIGLMNMEADEEEGSTCSSTDTSFYYRLLDQKEGPRVFPSNLSPIRHRKLYTTTSEIRKFFAECPNYAKDFGEVLKPDELLNKRKIPSRQSTASVHVNVAHNSSDKKNSTMESLLGQKNKRNSLAKKILVSSAKKTAGTTSKNTHAVVRKNTVAPSNKATGSTIKGAGSTPSKNKSIDRFDDDETDFDILSLIPKDAIPCMSLGVLSFREGTIDPKRGQLKRAHVFPVTR
ncbi:hypothetical protein G9A89_002703 [Geosiphon pyriformis]|nr:hypothetical protein G9A89_002703 [Geosiphon pyriformis]